ncbi:MAG: hypothetical protein Q9227_008994 [Pyrenula ochraceoflavens]
MAPRNSSAPKYPRISDAPLIWPEHPKQNPTWSINDVTANDVDDRHELFLLGDDEKKVVEEVDTRVPNCCMFTFNKEDHTLGNLIRTRLLQSPHIEFSAYKVPHPVFPNFVLRVQTDGEISPREAVITACKDLVSDLSTLSREFTKEFELRKMVQSTQNGD